VTEGLGEFLGSDGELGDLAVQGLEPLAGGGVVHGAVLERGVVAVDRGVLLLDLGGGWRRARRAGLRARRGDAVVPG
jgi:hypothetical protein